MRQVIIATQSYKLKLTSRKNSLNSKENGNCRISCKKLGIKLNKLLNCFLFSLVAIFTVILPLPTLTQKLS